MTNKDVERKVTQAFTKNVPNVLDNILSECDKQKDRVITMSETQAKRKSIRWAAGIAAAFVLILTGIFGVQFYQTNYSVDSIVSLDVNPSIEIKTNQKEQVLAVNALNEDAKIVIGEMSFKGCSLDVAVNALIGSMLRNGYLNEAANSILISVCGDNSEKTAALQEKLADEISTMLQTDAFSGAVLSQTVLPDSELQALADSYQISLGRVQLIQKFINKNPQYSFEELAGLTINELNLLSKKNGFTLEEVNSIGDVSEKAYIGIEKAKETAFSHAGVTDENNVSKLEIEMDYEHGIMIYEVSFLYNGNKYNYDINANTGEITEAKSNPAGDKEKAEEEKNKSESGTDETGNAVISADEAKELAFSHAGVAAEQDIAGLEIERGKENGKTVYEIEFSYKSYEYEYEIDAATGEIIEFERNSSKEKNQSVSKSDNSDPINIHKKLTDTAEDIGEETAKELALSFAQLNADEISNYKIERYEKEEDIPIYKIKFSADGYQYSYDINALTGEILKYDKQPEYTGQR